MNVRSFCLRLSASLSLLCSPLLLAQTLPANAPGQLDTSFGTGGQVEFDFANECTTSQPGVSGVTQPLLTAAGQITLAGGTSTNCGAVAISSAAGAFRLTDSGALDSAFSGNGRALYAIISGVETMSLTAAALQVDGKLVAGSSENGDVIVYRFNADGSVDTGFGSNGRSVVTRATLGISGPDAPSQIVVQADGRILMAGRGDNGGQVHFYYLLRFNANGTRDTSFDGDGFFISNDDLIGTEGNQSRRTVTGVALALQGDRVVVAYLVRGFNPTLNQGIDNYMFARHRVDGSRDTAFGTSGLFVLQNDIVGSPENIDLAIQTDGRVVFTTDGLPLGRLTADGALDSSFGGGDGQVFRSDFFRTLNQREMTSAGNTNLTRFRHVVIQSDGRIVLSGNTLSGGTVNFNSRTRLARFLADGTPDLSFGDDVIQIADTTAPFTTFEFFQLGAEARLPTAGLAIDAQGRIVVSGVDLNEAGSHALGKVARLLGATGVDADIRPDAFTLADQFDVPTGSVRTSLPITVSGIADQGFALIRVDGGTYSINGGSFSNAMEKVRNGDVITVRHTAAATPGTRTTTRLRLSAAADEVAENFFSVTAGGVCAGSAIPATLDTTFDADGIRARNIGTNDGHRLSLLLTADDRPFLATGTRSDLPGFAAAVRFTTGGADDSDFSGDGQALLGRVGPFTTGEEFLAAARQADGKILATAVLSSGTNSVGVIRINPNGSLDSSFSGDGVALIERSQIDVDARGFALAVQADGKVLLAGRFDGTAFGGQRGTFITRFNADGTLDDGGAQDSTPGEGWSVGDANGVDGIFVDTSSPASLVGSEGLSLRVQGSRVILMGTNQSSLLFFGHSANGARDNPFGSNGVTQIAQPVGAPFCNSVDFLVRADSKLLFTSSCITVGQLNANGTLDTSFSGDGLVFRTPAARRELTNDLTNSTFNPRRIALQADDKIVIAGAETFGGPMKLARFLADGLPDTGFGDDRIEISFGSGFRNNVGLAVDGLGRVIFADTEASATPVNLLVGSLCGGPSVDTRVDDFVFADQTGVPRSSVRTSAPITISGLRATVPAILRVEGGTYSIGCGADNTYTDAMEKVVNGQTVCLRHISAGTDGTSVNTTLRVSAGPDEFSDVFTSTTGVPVVPGMLQFSAATFSAAENAGTASVTVTRTGGTQGSVSVTLNGAGAPITVNFANGQASQIVNLPVSDNSTDGPDQTLNLTLNEATGGASLGAQNRSVLTVTDDDAAPTVSFTLTASTAAEGDGTRQIAVQLSAASGFAISVTLEVSGTADGADFSLGSATLNFAPGGTTAQATINLADDSAAESAETIVLRLINPLNASLGSQTSHSVTVAASDTAPPPPPPAAADAPAQASAKSGSALGLPLLGGLLLAFARRRRVLAAAVLLAGSAQAVQAQEAARWYVSGSLGSSQAGNDVSALRQRLAAEGHNVDYQLDDRELGGTFLIGRQVHPRAAIEAGYTRLGHFTASANGTTPDAAALLQTLVHTVPLGGNSVGLGLRYFFGDGALRFEPHVGVLFYQAERAAEVNGLRSSRRVHGLGGSVGLGAGWTFVPDWQATADWTLAVPGSDNTVQSLSLGLRWWM